MRLKLAVFDLDGTLLDGQSTGLLLKWLWRRRWRRGRILRLMGSKIPAYALRKTGLLNRLRVQNSWLREWDTVIDWPASTAFSDGYPDVPLLEPAGTPVAVFPDERLLQHARDCNWRIMLPGS